jgi:hypothetical protein
MYSINSDRFKSIIAKGYIMVNFTFKIYAFSYTSYIIMIQVKLTMLI